MRPFFALILAIVLSSCAAPSPNGAAGPAEPMPDAAAGTRDAAQAAPRAGSTPADATPAPVKKPMRTGGPLPPDPVEAAGPGAVAIDTTCRVDADCTVKNVGNCCGYAPACVNVDSPTDPEGVRAECTRQGRMSVCGFQDISACRCVQGRCEAAAEAVR